MEKFRGKLLRKSSRWKQEPEWRIMKKRIGESERMNNKTRNKFEMELIKN
jgi:hypothetical protein